jgi:hypothetical protein
VAVARSHTMWTTGILTAAVAAGTLLSSPVQALGGDPVTDAGSAFTAKLDIGDGQRACTGTLIDNQWILTAASCFADDPAQPQALAPGAPKLKTSAVIGRADLTTGAGAVRQIVELIPRQDRDLVLARLDSRVPGILPLPVATTAPTAGETLHSAGYGRTEDTWVPDQLHDGPLTTSAVTGTTLAVDGTAVCEGDAGAPLYRTTDGRPQLAGVVSTSWQGGCLGSEETRAGSIAGRVDDLAGWIRTSTAATQTAVRVQIAGSDGALYDNSQSAAGAWDGWNRQDMTGFTSLTSTTVATKVEVYGISGGKLYNKSYDKSPGNGRWSQWTAVPGGAAGLRSVTAATSGGVAHLALVGSDNAVYTTGANYSTGTWSPVTRLDGTGLTALTSTVTGTTLHLYGLGNGRRGPRARNYTTGTWSPWTPVPGGAAGAKAITSSTN